MIAKNSSSSAAPEKKSIETSSIAKKSRGRPKKFDYEIASKQALELFWKQGFEGTSISDLSETLNMNRPSIYASFGNKHVLFETVLKKYMDNHLKFIDEAIAKDSLSEVFNTLFSHQISLLTQYEDPRGCLLVQAAASGSKGTQEIKELLTAQRKGIEAKLRKRIQLAQLKKDFPTKQSPSALAKGMMAIYEGISIEAASGSSKTELLNIAELSKKILS